MKNWALHSLLVAAICASLMIFISAIIDWITSFKYLYIVEELFISLSYAIIMGWVFLLLDFLGGLVTRYLLNLRPLINKYLIIGLISILIAIVDLWLGNSGRGLVVEIPEVIIALINSLLYILVFSTTLKSKYLRQ